MSVAPLQRSTAKGRHSTQLPPLLPPPTHLANVAVTCRVAEGGAGGEAGRWEGGVRLLLAQACMQPTPAASSALYK